MVLRMENLQQPQIMISGLLEFKCNLNLVGHANLPFPIRITYCHFCLSSNQFPWYLIE